MVVSQYENKEIRLLYCKFAFKYAYKMVTHLQACLGYLRRNSNGDKCWQVLSINSDFYRMSGLVVCNCSSR